MPAEPRLSGRGSTPPARGRERAGELLGAGKPHEVLARIVPDDPLELRTRIGARLNEQALLLDAERVLLVAQVQCALHSTSWRVECELACWLDARVDEALEIVLAEDGVPGELVPFAAPLALDPCGLAGACKRFNALPFEQREAFFALVLDSASPDRAARSRGLSLSELARRARSALQLFLPAAPPGTTGPPSTSKS